MPLTDFLQVNDVGIQLITTIKNSDGVTPINLSTATNLTIYIYRPDSELIVGPASLVTDGTDGRIQYTTQTTDLTVPGIYRIQATYQIGGNLKHTDRSVFCIEPNLPSVS